MPKSNSQSGRNLNPTGYRILTREDDDVFWKKNHTTPTAPTAEEQQIWQRRSGAPYGGEERRKSWDGVERRNLSFEPWNGLERRKKRGT